MTNLLVTDTRSGAEYTIPIVNNTVQATEFARIKLSETAKGSAHHADEGIRVLDPGFRNTAVKQSSITKLDGQRGTIQYRGHDIEYLFNNCEFEEVAYLLIWGHLPDLVEKEKFRSSLMTAMVPPLQVQQIVSAFPASAPEFTIAQAALCAWNAAEKDHIPAARGENLYTPERIDAVDQGAIRAFAANATCNALASCHARNVKFNEPYITASMAYNILLMYGHIDKKTGSPHPDSVKLLDKVLILYADHELTNSTAAFLHVASTLADPLSCTIAGISAGNGPLHGGAIQMAYAQFAQIGRLENVPALLQRVRNKEIKLFGFGHRIWRTTDPRLPLIKQIMKSDALAKSFQNNPLLAVAMEVEAQASQDEYFIKNRISANVDLMGCFVFNALGFSTDSVLGVATIARTAGVLAHWREQIQTSKAIWRPQAIYLDPKQRDEQSVYTQLNNAVKEQVSGTPAVSSVSKQDSELPAEVSLVKQELSKMESSATKEDLHEVKAPAIKQDAKLPIVTVSVHSVENEHDFVKARPLVSQITIMLQA